MFRKEHKDVQVLCKMKKKLGTTNLVPPTQLVIYYFSCDGKMPEHSARRPFAALQVNAHLGLLSSINFMKCQKCFKIPSSVSTYKGILWLQHRPPRFLTTIHSICFLVWTLALISISYFMYLFAMSLQTSISGIIIVRTSLS